jgi:ribosome-associated translation inhibitor RaiA
VTAPDPVVDLDFLVQRVIRLERKLRKMKARCKRQHGDHECIGFKVEQDEDDGEEIDRTEVAK